MSAPRTWVIACLVLLAGSCADAGDGDVPLEADAPRAVAAGAPLPCDLYAAGGTPCVAAHSTVRALFAGYGGRLYRIERASDHAARDVGTLAAGGYANSAAQDRFCAGTTCSITVIYDQSARHNDLAVSGAGGAGAADLPSVAGALPVMAGGHLVYGLYVAAGNGYRNLAATGTARNGQAEGMYMVASGVHVNDRCCFDYGNTEQPRAIDVANGHMNAVYLGTRCAHPPCSGVGPWVAADLENGLYAGNGSNPGNAPVPFAFVTAMNKTDGQATFALRTGDAQAGGLTTAYAGTLPNGRFHGYIPLHQEGGIVLGVGGDNSRWSVGSFFEGAMTAGRPSDATEDAVQANIAAVGYAGDSAGGVPGTITGPATRCVDVEGDDAGGAGAAVQLWDCQSFAADQRWSYDPAERSLHALGRCLDVAGNRTANDTRVQLWNCNGVGGQKWVPQPDGSLRNPSSGRCLDAAGGAAANGVALRIHDCDGSAAQRFQLRAGVGPVGVVFYQDRDFAGGSSRPRGPGDYPTLPADVPDDWMSSVRVPPGWTVEAYAGPGFTGAVCTFTADRAWVGAGCNDQMSSFRVR